jgi:hypothetical protein
MPFEMNDLVVPKEPHNWHDICCKVTNTRGTMCLVDNGHGTAKWLHESQLEHVCDAVHRYVLHMIATDPEIAKKTIFVVSPSKETV